MKQIIIERNTLYNKIRSFFYERNVLEVETPILDFYTIPDPNIDSFETSYGIYNSNKKKLYLQTSPEFFMKKMLSDGVGSIYQICKAFRNGERGKKHNPEFSILEWYRVGFDMFQLISEVECLLEYILDKSLNPIRISYREIFKQYVGIDPLSTDIEILKKKVNELNIGTNIENIDCFSRDDILNIVFAEFIEKNMEHNIPISIYGFPISQASLSKRSYIDPLVADRFETYFMGLELANGFHELNDSIEQRIRFEFDNETRMEMGKDTIQINNSFIDCLDNIPNCSGVAIGLDRLLMICMDKLDISDVIYFPIN